MPCDSEEVGHIHAMCLRGGGTHTCHVTQRRWDTYMSCTCLRGGGTHTCHVRASEEVGHIHVMSCAKNCAISLFELSKRSDIARRYMNSINTLRFYLCVRLSVCV